MKLAEIIARDRRVDGARAQEMVRAYETWRGSIGKSAVSSLDETMASRFIEEDWLWEGRPSVLFAGQGRGKSNFTAWVTGLVLELRPNWDVYTNIPFPWDPDGRGEPRDSPSPRLHPISRLSEALTGAARSGAAGREAAWIIDEMDQAVTSHNWAGEDAQNWQRLINIERHLRIRGPLLVYHAYRHIPVVLREGTMLKSLLQVVVRRGERWVIKRDARGFLHVPPAVLPYLAYGLRGFDVDVDVQDLERHLSGNEESVREQLLAYFERREKAEATDRSFRDALVSRQRDIKDAVQRGESHKEIAARLGISRQRVSLIAGRP